ncbi:AAA family ATPase [Thalassotalea agarivorans]|uniref:General secretion pathway protein A n=1 Tax=Thalassotalea agarivorans TaxID=349064 RepID=A0A1I0HVT4_THASX|nr:AAA family ATPase [Thalassotalea agarivorans]SET87472.1 general secretion pathway protein A [Thalassotalea agarivorans]
MYLNYFGFSQAPFSIAPNPAFLFLSDRHKEALQHLSHGLGESGGFVLLTGEVGTGKTTISRYVLERVPENTEVAYILNPTLSSHELLATICDQLKIRYRKTDPSLKTLTDKILKKLTQNHQENKNTLLIIDEAQHLQAEVLEQLRLLTNLETNTQKLMQIVLIGQPELKTLLHRRDLRQLAQRITARYHLMPLTKKEVFQYIAHRLEVAGSEPHLFSKSAISRIYQKSGGIPRLINLLADKALLHSYLEKVDSVSKKTVDQVAREVLVFDTQDKPKSPSMDFKPLIYGGAFSFVCAAAGFITFHFYQQSAQEQYTAITQQTKEQQQQADLITAINQLSDNVEQQQKALDASISAQQQAAQQQAEQQPLILGETSGYTDLGDYASTAPDNASQTFTVEAVDGVSDEMMTLFQNAMEETDNGNEESDEVAVSELSNESDVTPLSQMPTHVQEAVPSLAFEMHMYATQGEGWVRVNGRDKYEGSLIAPNVVLEEIHPQHVVLSMDGYVFSLPALTSW